MRHEIPVKPNSQRKVVFTDTVIWSDGVELPYNDVVGISFYSGYSQGRLFDSSAGVIILRSASKRLKISIRNVGFWGAGTSMVNSYAEICQEIMRRVAPLVLKRLVEQILAGGTVQIGRLTIDSVGITSANALGSRKRATWNLSPEVRTTTKDHWYVAMTRSGVLEVSYFYPPTGKMIAVGTATSRDENGSLLSSLLLFMTQLHKARNA